MFTTRLKSPLAGLLVLTVLTGGASLRAKRARAGFAEAPKGAKVTVQLRGAVGDKSVEAFRTALKQVKGIKFDPNVIEKGEEPRFYTNAFTIEIADISKTDIGALAKAAVEADTPVKDDIKPGLNLWLYTSEEVGERLVVKVRDALVETKGVDVKVRGVGGSPPDQAIWIKLDGSGQARLKTILETLAAAGIKARPESTP